MRWLAQNWFRVEVRGAENIPTSGSALLVSNRAGTMPLDSMVLHSVVYDEVARPVRLLGADLVFKTPYVNDFARKTGTTLACQEDAERMLPANNWSPSIRRGSRDWASPTGIATSCRASVAGFRLGGRAGSGADRAGVGGRFGGDLPLLSTAPTLARALGFPYFPVTPTFPWFGVLGMIPLPSKWIIEFGECITTDELPAGSADDPMIVFNVTDQVRETIQQTLYSLLMQRRSAFF